MLCMPLPEPRPRLSQPEKAIAVIMAKLSAASVDFTVVFMVADDLMGVIAGAAGHAEDGDDQCQGH